MKTDFKKKRKYIIIIGDGMSDEPLDELGGKTPLEFAKTPNLDFLASKGVLGLARTVPNGVAPGSDTANLSIFGYNPLKAYTGRAPLEALNMGIELKGRDAAFRCNIVELADGLMKDFTADHIDSAFSRIIMTELSSSFNRKGIEFYPGVSYRNMLIWRDFPYDKIPTTVPPHDITGKKYAGYLPSGDGSDLLKEIMTFSGSVIADSKSITDARQKLNGKPVSVWLWGGGFKPSIDETLESRFGIKGYTISAVDLIHGIGRAVGLVPKDVEGVTGYIDTNYKGKADAAIECLSDDADLVFVHIEAPDESGHEGNIEHKVQSIEDLDAKVIGPILKGAEQFEDCTILCMADHPTPIRLKTHSSDPVPFAIYRKQGFSASAAKVSSYSEKEAKRSELFVEDASVLMGAIVKGSL